MQVLRSLALVASRSSACVSLCSSLSVARAASASCESLLRALPSPRELVDAISRSTSASDEDEDALLDRLAFEGLSASHAPAGVAARLRRWLDGDGSEAAAGGDELEEVDSADSLRPSWMGGIWLAVPKRKPSYAVKRKRQMNPLYANDAELNVRHRRRERGMRRAPCGWSATRVASASVCALSASASLRVNEETRPLATPLSLSLSQSLRLAPCCGGPPPVRALSLLSRACFSPQTHPWRGKQLRLWICT